MLGNSEAFAVLPLRMSQTCSKRSSLKGPTRLLRLCALGILLPAILFAVPLYLRYRVYKQQLYPLAMSDMRIIDGRISTAWCQRQLVKANATFNAFLLPETPKVAEHLQPLSMVRHLLLEDDMKEYWGFYLLKGSIARVSSCVRWPGASLIFIRGHKHLHECAYIGDNSSEEMDEAEELRADGPANRPNKMRRHRHDVQFLHPGPISTMNNQSLIDQPPGGLDENVSDTDGDIKKTLDNLQNKTKTVRKWSTKDKNKRQRYTNSPIESPENKVSSNTSAIHAATTSEEMIEDIWLKLEKLGTKSGDILDRLNKKFKHNFTSIYNQTERKEFYPSRTISKPPNKKRRDLTRTTLDLLSGVDQNENFAQEEGLNDFTEHRGTFVEANTSKDMSNSEFWSSFSSSEEALLNCEGLILNLPLSPHHKCSADLPHEQAEETYRMNTVTYKIPSNGYYFFVFNSENEVQQNYLRVQFELEKVVYDVSSPLAVCSNSSAECALDLRFLSKQKVVLQLPLLNGETSFNEEIVAESECEPRSALYALCVLAVPVVFILFAFT